MEKALKEQQKPLTSAQMFAMQANINLEHEQRLENVEKRLDAMEQERKKMANFCYQYQCHQKCYPKSRYATKFVNW